MSDSIQIKPLSLVPEHYESVLQLIEEEFGYKNTPHRFEIDFYPLIGKHNWQHCYVVFIDGEIVGHIGVKLRSLQYKNHAIPSALLGGIAIKSSWQRKGLMGHALPQVIDKYKDQVGLFFLWGNLTNLYSKFAFFECGGVIQIDNNEMLIPHDQHYEYQREEFKNLNLQDKEKIEYLHKDFYTNKYLTFSRWPNDWEEIGHIQSTEFYCKRNNGVITSYFFAGKGKDLENIIHEQVHFSQILNSNYHLWLPESFSKQYPNSKLLYMGFCKVGSINLLTRFLEQISAGKLSITEKIKENASLKFTFKGKHFEESEENFLRMLFGPKPLAEFQEFMPDLFICGLDSV